METLQLLPRLGSLSELLRAVALHKHVLFTATVAYQTAGFGGVAFALLGMLLPAGRSRA